MTPLFDLPAPPLVPLTGEEGGYPVRRIFCVGRNYAAHAAEMGHEVDREAPFYFTKSPASVLLSGQDMPYPQGTADLHHEMELALAIGSGGREIAPERAMDHVLAYGCALDMTRRDLQARAKDKRRPWCLGKDFENAAILAPMTRAADLGDLAGRRIALKVNGETRQEAVLDDLIWSIPELIADLSRYYTLAPGDLILTGTPAGVGPVQRGDRLEGHIDGLAPLETAIV